MDLQPEERPPDQSALGQRAVDVSPGESPLPSAEQPELPLAFHGSAREYFRIWIVNLCLTLLTLGIFSPWAKVRKKRYFYARTTLGGTPFQYLAQPIPILKGRLVAVAGFVLYYLSRHFFTGMLPWVVGLGLIAAPWIMNRSLAFRARYSAFRNITFRFGGTYWQSLRVLYLEGLIPLSLVVLIFEWGDTFFQVQVINAVAMALFALLFPWWICRLKRYTVSHTGFGGRQGIFKASGWQFYKIYLGATGIMLAGMIPIVLLFFAIATASEGLRHLRIWTIYVLPILTYILYALIYASVQARSGNLVWNHTRIGPLRFDSTLGGWHLAKLYLTNALGILLSAGLLVPWAVIRTYTYRIDCLRVLRKGFVADFQGSDWAGVEALGAETMDIFDLDLGL